MEEILKLSDIEYSYKGQGGTVKAVKKASGVFCKGKVYAITGRSGSGKSTLMSLLAGLDLPQKGKLYFKGKSMDEINRNKYRSNDVGLIFQAFNLLPQLTALENTILSLEMCKLPAGKQKARAMELLEKVGIDSSKAKRKVLKLSGGEQQRIAIARALGANPSLILADEPTGNLDSETGDTVMDMLVDLAHNEDRCVIVITHAESVAKQADEIWGMKDGVLIPLKVTQ